MNLNRPLGVFAALNGAMAVLIGAFAAHGAGPGVRTLLTTGGHYQGLHAVLGLVVAVALGHRRLALVGGWLASAGGLVFCLTLALLAWTSTPALGAVAPIGGLLMVAGWIVLAVALAATPSSASIR